MLPARVFKTACLAAFVAVLLLWGGISAVNAQQATNSAAVTQQQPEIRLNLEQVAYLNTVEDRLFGGHNQMEAPAARLARVEQTLFGQIRAQASVGDRIRLIQEALARVQPPPSSSYQPMQQQPGYYVPPQQPQYTQAPAPASPAYENETDYPAVTALEQKVFGRTFEDTDDDITQRLERLEMATFQTVQRGALADRVDNLQLLVFGDNRPRAVTAVNTTGQQPQNVVYEPTYISTNQADLTAAASEVEHQVFKQTFPADPLPARLDRLENKLFNGTSPEMSEEDRMQRIIAVSAAGGDKPGPGPSSGSSKKDALGVILPIVLTVLLGLL